MANNSCVVDPLLFCRKTNIYLQYLYYSTCSIWKKFIYLELFCCKKVAKHMQRQFGPKSLEFAPWSFAPHCDHSQLFNFCQKTGESREAHRECTNFLIAPKSLRDSFGTYNRVSVKSGKKPRNSLIPWEVGEFRLEVRETAYFSKSIKIQKCLILDDKLHRKSKNMLTESRGKLEKSGGKVGKFWV